MQLNNSNPTRSKTATVFGLLPALQDVAVAVSTPYKDNVTVTVTY
jgi:spore coat protein U-like protein